jgi:dihydroflavonol-4-reductase
LETVLVTGATGFVGIHCIARLLTEGYRVRGTVRALARRADVIAMLLRAGLDAGKTFELVEANLNDDAGWDEALRGCEYVLHVASPFPGTAPDDPDDLIRPAREGTLRVLRAAQAADVRRVVLTSSIAAVAYGHTVRGRLYDERDWTDLASPEADAYTTSKTVAERAAWDFVSQQTGAPELTVIAPVGVFGPVLGKPLSTSTAMIRHMLAGHLPAVPRIHFGVVDVRDLADLQLRAMLVSQAAGERFIATAGTDHSMLDLADILREALPTYRDRLPKANLPDDQAPVWLAPQLGICRDTTSEKATRMLDWRPRSTREAIVATAESLVALGLAE